MVDIPISANANAVVSTFREITNAIQRAKGEAADFAAVDLSHSEIGGLSQEIKQVLKNFEDLVRVGRGSTAAGVRAGIGGNPNTWVNDQDRLKAFQSWSASVEKQYPDAADRARHVRNTVGYITRGTSLEPSDDEDSSPSPAPNTPLPKRQSENWFRRGGRSVGTRIGGALAGEAGEDIGGALGAGGAGLASGIALPLLAIAGLAGVGKMTGKAVSQAGQEDQVDDQFLRTIQGSVEDFSSLRDAVRESAKGLQLTNQQMGALGQNFAQIANISDPAAALAGARGAAGFARATGIDVGAANSAFSSATLMGMDPERFAMLIEEAAVKGNMQSQSGQVMQAMLTFMQSAARTQVLSGAINGATDNFAAMYAAMNATGDPGLHGQNAEAILNSVNSSVMNGGNAGMAGQVMTFQALARAGVRNPYEAMYDMQGGAFGVVNLPNGKDTDMFDIMRPAFSRYQAGYQRDFAESQYFGINMRQAGALDSIVPADLSKTVNYFSSLGIGTDKINVAAIPDIANLLNAPDRAAAMAKVKKQLLDGGQLNPADTAAINSAGSPDALMKALVTGLNDTGLQKDESTKYQQSLSDLTNAITAAGTGLIPVVSTLTAGITKLMTPLDSISKDLDQMLGHNIKKSTGASIFGQPLVGASNPGGANRPLRNNNPLNIKGGYFGATGVDAGDFSVFSDVATGLSGAVQQIKSYEDNRGLKTLGAVDSRFSPASDNPNERGLLDKYEPQFHLNDGSDLTNPATLARYIQMKSIMEGAPVSAAQAAQAVLVSFDPVTVHVKTPHGSVTAKAVPKQVNPVSAHNPPAPAPSTAPSGVVPPPPPPDLYPQ
jgi:hypothetical protein